MGGRRSDRWSRADEPAGAATRICGPPRSVIEWCADSRVCDCCRLSTSIYACTSDASLFRISVISRRPEAQRAGVCGLATWPVAFSILVSVT